MPAEDRDQGLRRIDAVGIGNRQARAVQPPHAGYFLLRVGDPGHTDRLLRLEHGIDTFRRDDDLSLKLKDEWRVLTVLIPTVRIPAGCVRTPCKARALGVRSDRVVGRGSRSG